MEPPAPSPSWRPGWRLWLLLLVLVSFAIGLVWFFSDRDLAAIDRRATALGVPTSWKDLGLQRSPATQLAAWRRLEALAKAVECYGSPRTGGRPPQPGEACPPELAAHHERLPPAQVAELLALCDALPADGLVLHAQWDWSTPMPEHEAARDVCRLLAERVALAAPAEVAGEAGRILALATAHRPITLIQGLVAISELALWQQAVSRRLREPGVDAAALATQAARARAWLGPAMLQAWTGEFVFVRTLLHGTVRGKAGYGPELAAEIGLPRWLSGCGLQRPLLRLCRSDVLAAGLAQVELASPGIDHRHRLAAHAAAASVPSGWWWSPGARATSLLMDNHELIAGAWAKADAGLAVIAAEAGGGPWPDDPMDPAGGPLRRIERDGRLIGYYLLGRDGRDDGGQTSPRRDECFPLYERLGSPRAADPPPAPQALTFTPFMPGMTWPPPGLSGGR